MAIILFDNNKRNNLHPFTTTKAIASLRFGVVTIAERWALKTGLPTFIYTEKYLQNLTYVEKNFPKKLIIQHEMLTLMARYVIQHLILEPYKT